MGQRDFQTALLDFYCFHPGVDIPWVYKLGGDPAKRQTDCSLFVEMAAYKAGLISQKPSATHRTQAWRIYRGLDEFDSEAADPLNPQTGDLRCLRVPGSLDRPDGINHVGATIKWQGKYMIIDANGKTKGIRISPITGMWVKYLPEDGNRRLTIEDE